MRILAITHQREAGPGVFAEETRERQVELDEWLIGEQPEPPADPAGYDAVMTFGGAMNTHEEEKHQWLRRENELLAELLGRGMPLLGACLGTQLLAEAAGGEVRRSSQPEIGWHEVSITQEARGDPLLGDPPLSEFQAFQWHSYEAVPPAGSIILARSSVCSQAYRIGDRAWGIQFHAEVTAADAEKWIDEWRDDEDAVRIGLDPEVLRAETREKIAGWNQFGRELCGRFLDQVRVRSTR
ncbi:MAG: type 1 glutamine amidotransferase [Solirubrobacterales bacterium]